MVIDTSAIVAIVLNEPEADIFEEVIVNNHTSIAASNWLEAHIVLTARIKEIAFLELAALKKSLSLEIVHTNDSQIEIANSAFLNYGKGRHPAGLNYGDCFAYALAKETNQPLLFKGEDFAKTDVLVVPYQH